MGSETMPADEAAPRVRHDPDGARRVRTMLHGGATLLVVTPGLSGAYGESSGVTSVRHYVDTEGDVIVGLSPHDALSHRLGLAVARTDQGSGRELVGELRLLDVAPVAVPGRVRGRASVQGWITRFTPTRRQAEPAVAALAKASLYPLLRVEVASVRVEDRYGETYVEHEEFAAARPDPLASHEAGLLQRLAAGHRDDLDLLARRAAPELTLTRVAPLALDCDGLWLRGTAGTGNGGDADLRFDFETPVTQPALFPDAFARLLAAAREQPARNRE